MIHLLVRNTEFLLFAFLNVMGKSIGHVPKSTSKYFRGRHQRNKVDKVLKYVVGDTATIPETINAMPLLYPCIT